MGTPSACWRRPDNLTVVSSACRKQGELGKQISFASKYRVFCSGQEETEIRHGLYGAGLAVRETICRTYVYTHRLTHERVMSMRLELTGERVAIKLVVT